MGEIDGMGRAIIVTLYAYTHYRPEMGKGANQRDAQLGRAQRRNRLKRSAGALSIGFLRRILPVAPILPGGDFFRVRGI